ncbi:MAG: DUF177 domain-containing protein [Candidatus Omnitrophica bacterium]|nr:DUF177 domain-containing protein [Candidatus Omnitrophota bacterium]
MKVYPNQIPEGGLSAKESLSAIPYDLDTEDVQVLSPFEISYQLYREGGDLFVHLSLSYVMRLQCGRCLAFYESPLVKEVELTYPIEKAKVIDLTDDIRQEILLEYPMKPLCQEGCKGVCGACGQNLNEATCSCSNEVKT